MNRDRVLDDIAGAILDGTPVDWTRCDSPDSPIDQALVEQLRTLSALQRMPRTGSSTLPQEPWNWGHLQVFERIGHGAFGDVHRAWDTRLEREVALKLLHSTARSSEGSDAIEEGRLLARVRHPNVVTIYGAERTGGRVGLWMELITGRTLEQAMRDGRKFTTAEVIRLGMDLSRAISAVHNAGLLHRDIKAQNIMLDESGRLVLMDFGTGRELGVPPDSQTAGTPLYLAPEVLSGGEARPPSDVYSIGVVLFRLATGSYPVFGANLSDLRRVHATAGGAVALERPEIPVRLRRVLARALDPNPDRRYADADELGAALGGLQRTPLLRRVMYAAAGVAALVGVIASGWTFVVRRTLTPAPSVQATSAKIPAVAVMPFTNAGSDPGNDDFVDGLTSEVIHNLAGINGLETRSQTSSFFFKARPRDVHDISKQLGVDYIVEATVHRAGNRLRINAQLVRIPDDVSEWTESFDRTFDDVFAIQDEISRAIVNRLRLKLGSGQRRYQPNLQAYELYLRAKALISRKAMGQDAIKLFEQATIIDPGYAQAYAGLAAAYAARSWPISGGLSLDQGLDGMRPAAAKALQIDPLLAEAHVAMGVTYATELRWEDATKSFERALELEPTFTQAHAAYAKTLITLQQSEKAVELLTSALKVDPLSIDLLESLAWAQFQAGRYDESIATWRQVLATDPTLSDQGLARTLTAAGRPLEAIAVWESRPRADRLAAEGDWERWITRAYVLAGRNADVQRILEAPSNTFPFRQALIYSAVRDKDRTFEALNRAVDETPHRVAFTLAAPEMAFLRGDPRLDALRKRLHLQ